MSAIARVGTRVGPVAAIRDAHGRYSFTVDGEHYTPAEFWELRNAFESVLESVEWASLEEWE